MATPHQWSDASFFEAAFPAISPGPNRAEAEANITKMIQDPDSPLQAGISLLIAAARIPELNEIIIPQVQEWLRELGISDDRSDISSLQKLSRISLILGCLYFTAADMLDVDDWESIRPLANYVLENPDAQGVPDVSAEVPPPIVVKTDNDIRDALVNGAARVIARSGVERATTQRIARAAALSPSSLFTEYRNRQALFTDVAEKLLNLLFRQARVDDILPPVDPTDADVHPATDFDDPRLVMHRDFLSQRGAASSSALLSPAAIEQRRIRLEFHLAAISDPAIKEALIKADNLATEYASHQLQYRFGIPKNKAIPAVRMARLLVQGSLLLEEISESMNGRDLRYVYKPLADGFSRMVVDETFSAHR